MLGLNEGVGVEKVTGAVDETEVGGCIELLPDLARLDTKVDVETLDILALLDAAALLLTG